jgi:hypothetical protein
MYQKKRAVKCHQGLNGRHSCTTLCLNNIVRCFKWILLLPNGASRLLVPVNAVRSTSQTESQRICEGVCTFSDQLAIKNNDRKKCVLFHLTTISQLPLATPTECLQRKYETKVDI